jgi:NAD(P)-dependent dehydrogenase (short-subunit alcohol dehydrogenase family)
LFLLTKLLVPGLSANAPARIVYANSTLHCRAQIHFDDLQLTMGYTGPSTYGQAKLASVPTAYELARRLNGTGVQVNVADPLGASSTDLVKKSAISTRFTGRVLMSVLSLYLTPQRAARSSNALHSNVAALPELMRQMYQHSPNCLPISSDDGSCMGSPYFSSGKWS